MIACVLPVDINMVAVVNLHSASVLAYDMVLFSSCAVSCTNVTLLTLNTNAARDA